ncbi:MAG TPA: metalloregulator ArsR/SmtB family transcription factor [Actinocrinis sp.]
MGAVPRNDAPARVEPEVLQEAADLFGLLASATRLHLVWLLAHGEQDVTSLAEEVGGAVPAVSQHLAKLRLAGMVASRREGRRQVYLIADPRISQAVLQMVQSPPRAGRAGWLRRRAAGE